MNRTKIPWTDYTWNPVTGCTPVSEGCQHCYCRAMEKRFGWETKVTMHPERLAGPLTLAKPARIFACSMSDLFHDDVPDTFIEAVFGVMAITPHLTYQVLTKRPARMKEWLSNASHGYCVAEITEMLGRLRSEHKRTGSRVFEQIGPGWPWPLPNVWLGVTAENQARADERIPLLLRVPAKVRWLSIEPLLQSVDLSRVTAGPYFLDVLQGKYGTVQAETDFCFGMASLGTVRWVVIGAQTDPGAVPPQAHWVESIIGQCVEAKIPIFVKENVAKALGWPEVPAELRQFPEVGNAE